MTADAGLTTEKLADAVLSQGGTLMVGLKPNQPTLFDAASVKVWLLRIAKDGHGRSTEYTCKVC